LGRRSPAKESFSRPIARRHASQSNACPLDCSSPSLLKIAVELRAGYRRLNSDQPGKISKLLGTVRNAHPGILLSVDANRRLPLADSDHLSGSVNLAADAGAPHRVGRNNLPITQSPPKTLQTPICLERVNPPRSRAKPSLELGAARITTSN